MRIIAGKFRSRHLHTLSGLALRPTSDKLRETLFNVLSAGAPQQLSGSIWIDCFAGSGAVGLEALSRGAESVYFIETNPAATAVIRHNLVSLGVAAGFEILAKPAITALTALSRQGVVSDYCFLDPPYRDHAAYTEVLGLLGGQCVLKPGGLAIAEHERRFDPGENFGRLVRYRRLEQGDSALSFYRAAS